LFAWISRFVASASATRHCNVHEVVVGNDDGATTRSSYIVIGTDDAPPAIVVTSGYEDQLVRIDGRWRFARRVHTLDASHGVVDEHPRE
jgi:SnoaL-like domain